MASPLLSAMTRLLALGRPHRALLGMAFVAMGLVALSTASYALLMGPGLEFLLSGGARGLDRIVAWIPSVATLDSGSLVWALPIALLAVGAVKGVGYLGQFYFVGLFGQRVVIDLRRQLFEKMLRLSPSQRAARLSGDLLSRFTADVAAVEQAATYTVASWLRDTLQIAVLAGAAVWLSWKLSVLVLLTVPLAWWPATRLTAALVRRTREGQAALASIAGQVQEGLGAMRTLQAFNAEHAEAQRFSRRTSQLQRALTRAAWARAAVPAVAGILGSIVLAGLLTWVLRAGAVEPAVLVSFIGAMALVSQPAKDLGRVSQFALTAGVALERIESVLSLPELAHQGTGELASLAKEIAFHDVSFSWGERRALNGLSLSLPVGQVTALVGESGSGKSTLVSLLLRLEVPQSGRITLDGIDVSTLSFDAIRRQFALVTQEPLLFSDTVRENLRLYRPTATDAELERACRTAAAWDFITALPQGLDTQLGERGVTLSGGQRQRLCLARAVLADAPVLILDEATSNLDPQSEREVQAALDAVLIGRTAVVIAHRLERIKTAHRIVVLSQGRVAESGTHEALLATSGHYRFLWERESGGSGFTNS